MNSTKKTNKTITNNTELKEKLNNLATVQRKLIKYQQELQKISEPLMKKIEVAKELEKELTEQIVSYAETNKVKKISGSFLTLKWIKRTHPIWDEDSKIIEELKSLNLHDLIRIKEEPKKNEIKNYIEKNNITLKTYKEEIKETVRIVPKNI